MQDNFIDLDELIVLCRDKRAKQLIQEAVACYRAGAFRSCIVATWNAVVFDFLHKLRELELFGDAEATKLLEHFEKISSDPPDVKALWQFESNIPDWALTKFELIASIEKTDIQRLLDDRSRCAHPSMTSLEEPFTATAELARYHLRSAVTHILQRPPVQGRAAKERIFSDIESELFFTDVEKAVVYFQKGLLARARFTLIKDIVRGLTIDLLTKDRRDDERARQFTALNAVARIYPQRTREILNDGLSNIIVNKVTDENLEKVVIYLGSVEVWEYLTEPCQLRIKAFIEKFDFFNPVTNHFFSGLTKKINLLCKASHIDFLKELVIIKLQVPLHKLLSIKASSNDKIFHREILNPLLQESLPQADISEIVEMAKDADDILSAAIKSYLPKAIKLASLEILVSIILDPNDISFNNLIEPCLKDKVNKASLKELIKINNIYQFAINPNSDLINLFKCRIEECMKTVTFEELLEDSDCGQKLPDELLIPVLRENIDVVINRFTESSSFSSASDNASLILKIVEYISSSQWQEILEAFCNNDQIHNSYACLNIFGILLKKSVEINGEIASYWLSFRQKIDQFNWKEINTLKRLIDTYQP
jgi:hypothetical protein